jgi:hypothetical protein
MTGILTHMRMIINARDLSPLHFSAKSVRFEMTSTFGGMLPLSPSVLTVQFDKPKASKGLAMNNMVLLFMGFLLL